MDLCRNHILHVFLLGSDAAAAKRVCSMRKGGVHPGSIGEQPAGHGCKLSGGLSPEKGA